MEPNSNVLRRQFDVGEHDNVAILPMRQVGLTTYIIVSKEQFKMFETDNTYVLEITDNL